MAHGTRWGSVLLLIGLGLAACADGRWPGLILADLAIEGATLIEVEIDDRDDGNVMTFERLDQRVVVSGERIVWVGPVGEGPPAERVVDGRGRYLIPGLWDAHVHFLYDEALTEAMPGLFLDWGILSVRFQGHFGR